MVSLKENAGTVITRDKRRAAGSLAGIYPSSCGKNKPLWTAEKEVHLEMKTFAHRLLSKVIWALPSLCATPATPHHHRFRCFKLGFAFSCSTLPKGHPSHHAACPRHFPTGLR